MTYTPPATLVVGESIIDIVRRPGGSDVAVGGSPANVALGLARLGGAVRLHTALADDPHGHMIADHLAASGVIIDSDSWTLERTSTATAEIRPDGSAEYVFEIDTTLAPIAHRDETHVHAGSIALFAEPGGATIERFLLALPDTVRLSLDPNIRGALAGPHNRALHRFEALARRAHLITLSDDDAAWLYPGWETNFVISHLLSGGRTELVAVTHGAQGATLASADSRVRVPAPRVEVVDTIGAGDTFTAAVIGALGEIAAGSPLSAEHLADTGRFACAARALTAQRRGANLPDRDAIMSMV